MPKGPRGEKRPAIGSTTIWQTTKFRLVVIAITLLNALFQALRQDWITTGMCVVLAAIFAVYIIRDKRKSDAKGS